MAVKQASINKGEVKGSGKAELYRLIGDGYHAMQTGKESSIEEVIARIEKRRASID